jgi:hypothetical protein
LPFSPDWKFSRVNRWLIDPNLDTRQGTFKTHATLVQASLNNLQKRQLRPLIGLRKSFGSQATKRFKLTVFRMQQCRGLQLCIKHSHYGLYHSATSLRYAIRISLSIIFIWAE